MKVSLNTIRQYVDFEVPPVAELVERINQQLGGVEEVIDIGAKYMGIIIAKVVTCEPHPDSDHLHICQIEVGNNPEYAKFKIPDSNFVQVVCGAPNVHADMFVAWLPPGATVPASYDKDPFVLDARTIRGVKSNGMLASPAELAIGDNHDGILEITEKDLSPVVALPLEPGQDFSALFELNDTIIDIENKMFTHRPDCFGQLGVAREISAILQGVVADDVSAADTRFENPDWYWLKPTFENATGIELHVENLVPEKVPRFMAVAMSGVQIQPSPFWLQCALVALGSKPINNVVDLTNYMMLLTAQPTHAYDYDKLRGGSLGVRMGKAGEKLTLLNGKTYDVTEDDIVIVDGEGPVGMGGVMGGGNSEVSASTKNIVLECATFDMYTIRKTSMRHGLFTDAVTRFNKGQSPLQNDRVLARLMTLTAESSGGRQASPIFDMPDKTGQLDEVSLSGEIRVSAEFINSRLGLNLKALQIGNLLRGANFASYASEDDETTLLITAPFWRTDIELPEDIVEEVGRLYGFDKLPRELPQRSMKPAPLNVQLEMKRKIRHILSGAGANEVLTYSFVHEKVLKGAGQDPVHAFRLGNALSPDLQYYRLSIVPSLLDKVHANIKAGHGHFALFELGKTHFKGEMDANDPSVPNEDTHVGFVVAAADKHKPEGAPYYLAKRYAEKIVDFSQVQLVKMTDFDISKDVWGLQLTAAYEPKRTALLVRDNQIWGVIGEFTAAARRSFKLPNYSAGFEVHLDIACKTKEAYQQLSRYPSVTQDISLKVSTDVALQDVFGCADQTLEALRSDMLTLKLSTIGIYQPDDGGTKTITLRVTATNHQRTLTDAEVIGYMAKIADDAHSALAAEQI